MRTPRGPLEIRSSLVGRPNVYNILAAVATATALDLPFSAIESGVPIASLGSPSEKLVASPSTEADGTARFTPVTPGVIGGLARYFNFDPTLARVLYVILSVVSVGFPGLLVYILLWVIMPESDR